MENPPLIVELSLQSYILADLQASYVWLPQGKLRNPACGRPCSATSKASLLNSWSEAKSLQPLRMRVSYLEVAVIIGHIYIYIILLYTILLTKICCKHNMYIIYIYRHRSCGRYIPTYWTYNPMDTSIKLHPNWILFLKLRCPCGHFQHEVVCWFFLLASSTAKLDQEYQPCGGFHKWVYPKTDRLQWKVPNKNGWFKGTPILETSMWKWII